MAEKVTLRDYQKSILDRLDVVKSGSATSAASYLGVEIGSRNVLVDLLDISETLVVPEIEPVPLVKPWFLGMANVRGVLYAINDLGQLIDKRFTEISSSTRALLINDTISSNVGVLADRLIGLRSMDTFKQIENDSEETVCFRPERYEDDEKRTWYVLDCEKLISSRDFEIPYVT
jgi:twitching motility protein PilI